MEASFQRAGTLTTEAVRGLGSADRETNLANRRLVRCTSKGRPRPNANPPSLADQMSLPDNQAKDMDAKQDTAGKVINGRINGRFAPGVSGNPGGSPEATRRAFNKRFLLDLAEDWQQHGREVFKRVR